MFVLKFFGTFCTFFRFRPATPNLIKLWKAFLRGCPKCTKCHLFTVRNTKLCTRAHRGHAPYPILVHTRKIFPVRYAFYFVSHTRILVSYHIFCAFSQKSDFHQAIRYRFLTENKFDVFGAQARSTYRMHKYVIWAKSCFFRSMTFGTSGCNF